jgi:hypothetical protein
MADAPKNWDAFYDFFKGVQKDMRKQGMRHVYRPGFQVTTSNRAALTTACGAGLRVGQVAGLKTGASDSSRNEIFKD